MGFPPYIARVENSLLQALPGTHRDALLQTLTGLTVDVRLHPDFRVANDLFSRALPRLYPALAFNGDAGEVAKAREIAEQVNPAIDLDGTEPTRRISICVGYEAAEISIGVSRWSVGTSVQSAPDAQPGAQAVAAALVMGNLFSRAFRQQETDSSGYLPPRWEILPDATDLSKSKVGRAYLVGAGAVGQAFVWMLASQPSSEGELVIVDHEPVEESNLQRYVLSTIQDIDRAKVEVASNALSGSSWTVEPVNQRWRTYFPEVEDGAVERVVLALDSARDRIGAQASLPRYIYNAWTHPADIGVTVHENFGTLPCVSCLYPPRESTPDYQQVAEAFNLDPNKVLAYWQLPTPISQPLDGTVVDNMRQSGKAIGESVTTTSLLEDLEAHLPSELLTRWAGSPVTELHRGGMCGGALLRFAEDQRKIAHVPVAHQSALAGILLALSLLAHASKVEWSRELRIQSLTSGIVSFPPSATRSSCICQDPDYVNRWQSKWM